MEKLLRKCLQIGFDFFVEKDIKIDILMESLREELYGWKFDICYNDKTDYFLLIGLNSNLEIVHIWLIKKDEIIRKMNGQSYFDEKLWKRESITITERLKSIKYFRKFDIIDKLNKDKLIELLKEIKEVK